MSYIRLEVKIGDRAVVIEDPVKITRFVRQPHTYEVNDIAEKIQAATAKALTALGIERQQ